MRRKKNGKPRPPIRDEYGHAKRHARRAKVGMPHFKFEDKPLED